MSGVIFWIRSFAGISVDAVDQVDRDNDASAFFSLAAVTEAMPRRSRHHQTTHQTRLTPQCPWHLPTGHWIGGGFLVTESLSGVVAKVEYLFEQAIFKPTSESLWRQNCITHGCLQFTSYSTQVVGKTPAANFSAAFTVSARIAPRAYTEAPQKKSRRFWLGEDDQLRLASIAEIETLRDSLLLNLQVVAVNDAATALQSVQGDMLEVELHLSGLSVTNPA